MASATDPRRVEGAQVHAKARFVKSLVACRRWFGNTAFVDGIVQQVLVDRSGRRANTTFNIEFDLPNGEKFRKKLNVRSVPVGFAAADASRGVGGRGYQWKFASVKNCHSS